MSLNVLLAAGAAMICTGCGRCNPHCPQQIDIPKEIAAIDAAIDVLKLEALR